MAQAEVVTVRMSRGNLETPWGFDIVPPLTISNVVGGSLADRAGLLNGDALVELEGHENLDLTLARQLLSKAQHKVELVVHRTGTEVHRIWKPSITENTEYNRFQHSVHNVGQQDGLGANRPAAVPSQTPSNVPLKVSLEHQNQESMNIPGFNVAAQPYGSHQEVKHLQYNSPMPLYSPQSAAEQYLQQTGGLFGTDPNLAKMKEAPSYLRSETLRLIQESEHSKDDSSHVRPVHPPSTRPDDIRPAPQNTSGLPQCYLCGRNILGVMCRAFDRTLHAECFQCATCGSSLKNQGHHFVNDKFYCDVHGRQLKGREDFRSSSSTTTLHPHSAIGGGPQTVTNTRKTQENVRAFYQPDIMARRPLSISPTPWKTQSPISPSNRGVPSSAAHYGQDLRNESFTSSTITHQSNDSMDGHSPYAIPHSAPLPPQIREATSPRRRPSIRKWPPPSNLTVKKFWQFDQRFMPTYQQQKIVSLSSYISELDREQHRTPSPKRYLLRGKNAPEKKNDSQRADAEPALAIVKVIREVFPSEKRFSRKAISEQPTPSGTPATAGETVEVTELSKAEELPFVFLEAKRPEQSQTGLLADDYEHQYAEPFALATSGVQSERDENIRVQSQDVPIPPVRKSLSAIDDTGSHVPASIIKEAEDTHNDESCLEGIPIRDAERHEPYYFSNLEVLPEGQRSPSASNSSTLLALVQKLRERELAAENSWIRRAEILEEKDLAPDLESTRETRANDAVWQPSFDAETTELIKESFVLRSGNLNSLEKNEQHNEHINKKDKNIESDGFTGKEKDAVLDGVDKIGAEDATNDIFGERKKVDANDSKNSQTLRSVGEQQEQYMEEQMQQGIEQKEETAVLLQEDVRVQRTLNERNDNVQFEQRTYVNQRARSRAAVAKQRSEEAERQREGDLARIEVFRERNIKQHGEISHAIWHNGYHSADRKLQKHYADINGAPKKLSRSCENLANQVESDENSTLETIRRHTHEILSEEAKKREEEEMRIRDENDKRIAIESIERHQRQLHEQQQQLSQLLDNAIIFLKNLDTDCSKKSPDSSICEGVGEVSNTHNDEDLSVTLKKADRIVETDGALSNKHSSVGDRMNENENETVERDPIESCEQLAHQHDRLETPSDRIVRAILELSDRHNSGTNKFAKTTTTTQQHIRQGDDSARGRGTLQTQGSRVPFCEHCKQQIRGAYVLATGLAWCPEHFVCANKACNRRLLDIGFVEDKGQKYCEQCFENLIAPHCAKCSQPITADCLNALQKQWHPHCFVCAHCHKPFGNSAFFLEQGLPYCEADWNALFTTKCVSCHYPIEAGDRWVEALGSAFHSNCFNCTSCNVNLEGESFYAKNGAPYCKLHA